MNYNLKIKDKEITLNVKKLTNIFQHSSGLMFRKKSQPLLFTFNKPTKISIHSFFCKPFIAIWLLDNKIINIKLIKPNRLSIKPKHKFNKLLEIPKNTEEYKKISKILDDTRNI